MDYFMVPHRTFSLKLNLCCQGCETRMKKLLQKIHGVDSISIDAEQGMVTISGTVDPSTVIKELQRHKKSAQLMKITLQPSPTIQEMHDQNMVAQLEQLSEIKGLKHAEVTYSKCVKLTFKGNKDNKLSHSDTRRKVVVEDDEHGPQVSSGGGRGCSVASFCGNLYGNGQYWPPPSPPCRCTHLELVVPPCPKNIPAVANNEPSAPPLPRAYAYPDSFGEKNPNSCKLM